jgi:hypothetical protein
VVKVAGNSWPSKHCHFKMFLWRWGLANTGSVRSSFGLRTQNWLRRLDILSTGG